jgi:tetratricopeptide (TPR) repeat protein
VDFTIDKALQRALELDSASADVQFAVGWASGNLSRYLEQKKALEAAIAANPNHPQAHSSYAVLLAMYKRFDEALAEAKEGVRLDPLSIMANHFLSFQYIWNRNYAEGIPVVLELLKMNPDDPLALRNYGWLLVEMGRYDEGLQYLNKAVTLGVFSGEAMLGYALAKKGDYTQARAIAEEFAREWNPKDALGAQYIAMIYANTHEEKLAMEWLRKEAKAGGPQALSGLMEPMWDPLQSIPEFREMVKMPVLPE